MEMGIPDVHVVFADEKGLNSSECETGRHLYCICKSEKQAKQTVKNLNRKNSIWENAFYETWAVRQ